MGRNLEDEYHRGINCPTTSIIETRMIYNGPPFDSFDAVIITAHQGRERAFRWVGELKTESPLSTYVSAASQSRRIEDGSKVRFMLGVVVDGERTFGPDFQPFCGVQDGGLVFKRMEEARDKVGIWEELEGNGEGAFRMFRRRLQTGAR